MIPPTDHDLYVTALTVDGEARGEPEQGQLAVAYVIMTRANLAASFKSAHGKNHPLFGDGSLSAVCKAPWQFSCWNTNDPNASRLASLLVTDPEYQRICLVVDDALNGRRPNPAPEATHYKVTALPWPRDWGAPIEPIAVIGAQSFYRL